ncbi:hypothetical protein PAESOLCIP111_03429 [Paenibacillus solanacearum]|uniref:Uncharacterized protein n=1 Tax=Paenibacillus solanacearum TaxID=2048548 RepID=A0A916K3L5_9BACL|nr:hypothetical protein [Paenibacillus solanacearum]CAG7632927.1 hypothetical protein PAESOLCIP111_03429 [Paenibacillus solanacearum]
MVISCEQIIRQLSIDPGQAAQAIRIVRIGETAAKSHGSRRSVPATNAAASATEPQLLMA